jgi:uncharacterized protein
VPIDFVTSFRVGNMSPRAARVRDAAEPTARFEQAEKHQMRLTTILRIAAPLLAVGAMTHASRAAGFACAKASTPVERTICGDPALSEADETLSALYRHLLTLAPAPEDVKNEQRRWLSAERNATADAMALRALYDARIGTLRNKIDQVQGGTHALPAAGGSCAGLGTPPNWNADKKCQVIESGAIPNAPGPALAFQTQSLDGEDSGGVKRHVVYIAGTGSILATLDSGVSYEPPRVIVTAAGTLLYLLGNTGGSGNFPDDALFVWRGTAWSRVDITAWIKDLSRRLPKGLAPGKGCIPIGSR